MQLARYQSTRIIGHFPGQGKPFPRFIIHHHDPIHPLNIVIRAMFRLTGATQTSRSGQMLCRLSAPRRTRLKIFNSENFKLEIYDAAATVTNNTGSLGT